MSEIYFICLAGLFLFLWIGCSNSDKQGKITHPVEENIPHHEKIQTVSAPTDMSRIKQPELKKFLLSLEEAKPVLSIREYQTGEHSALFGRITDMTTDDRNHIYILDNDTPALFKFDQDGKLLDIFGGTRGRGPTDLMRPFDIEIGKEGRIYVSDPLAGIKVLKSTGNSMEYITSFQSIHWSQFCLSGGKIFNRSFKWNDKEETDSAVSRLVHVYNAENGESLYSLGLPYQSSYSNVIQHYSGGGKIACIPATDTIIYSFRLFSYLYGYSPEGTLKWVTKLASFKGYRPISVISGGRGTQFISYSTDTPDEYREAIISIIPVAKSGNMMVQTAVNNSDEIDYKSYFISSETDEVLYQSKKLPRILYIDKHFYYTEIPGDNIAGVEKYEY